MYETTFNVWQFFADGISSLRKHETPYNWLYTDAAIEATLISLKANTCKTVSENSEINVFIKKCFPLLDDKYIFFISCFVG